MPPAQFQATAPSSGSHGPVSGIGHALFHADGTRHVCGGRLAGLRLTGLRLTGLRLIYERNNPGPTRA